MLTNEQKLKYLKESSVWQHQKSQKLYVIVDPEGQMKIDGQWFPSVIYKKLESGKHYSRKPDDFLSSFNPK